MTIIDAENLDKRLEQGTLSNEDIASLKSVITKMREGDFYELLTMEFSGKIKEVAQQMDLQVIIATHERAVIPFMDTVIDLSSDTVE